MKVSASLIVLAGTIDAKQYRAPRGLDKDGNKINGQHPKRRLQALNKFMCNWSGSYMDEGKSERFCKRYTDMIYRLEKAFDRDTCSFFDPAVRFGGPNPDPNMKGKVTAKNPNAKRPTKSRRLRREVEDGDNVNACDGMSEAECNEAAMEGLDCNAGDENNPALAPFCASDDDDSDGFIKRKMSMPNRKLKRYSTGLAKWCQRYVAECYGQRVHEHCVKRAARFLSELKIEDES